MNIADLIIILFLIAAVSRGIRIGFSRQVLSIIGFLVGLLIGSWLIPVFFKFFIGSDLNLIFGIIFVFTIAFGVSGIGDSLGYKFKNLADQTILKYVEAGFGVVLSIASVLLVVWLFAATLSQLPTTIMEEELSHSSIIRTLNRVMPSPPSVMARLKRFVNPDILQGVTPDGANTPIPSSSSPAIQAAADKASMSTVKVQGFGCGGVLTGSGFVAGDNLVMTNAHVIAGVKRPVVFDRNGKHGATPVLFDPDLDIAYLRVNNLAGPSLTLADEVIAKGEATALLGYPEGGDLTVTPGVVNVHTRVLGRDIYNSSINRRTVYEIQADVRSGDSGGPMVLPDGRVAGIIFAKALTKNSYGYAIAASEFTDDLSVAMSTNSPVSTQTCAAE